MSVIWRTSLGKQWTDAAQAVPCPTCNVEIGKACDTTVFREVAPNGFHRERGLYAEVLGFITVPDGLTLTAEGGA